MFNQDFRIDNVSYLVMKTYQKVSIKFFNCKTNITFYLEKGLNQIKKHSFELLSIVHLGIEFKAVIIFLYFMFNDGHFDKKFLIEMKKNIFLHSLTKCNKTLIAESF